MSSFLPWFTSLQCITFLRCPLLLGKITGLDQCSSEEFERFQRLNQAYQEKFGFPFVIAVKGLDRHAILYAFEKRLENDAAAERRTAIEQIIQIARFRLHMRAAESA